MWNSSWLAPRTTLRLGRWTAGSFRVCGVLGLALAVCLTVPIARARGLSPAIIVAVLVPSLIAFLASVKLSVIFSGSERIVFYRAALYVFAASALALRVLDLPMGHGLDLAAIGTLSVDAFGRIGCHLVGCCHGRPWRRGVRYGSAHADAGFPAALVGVPLFPIPLVEAALVFALIAGASALVAHQAPGDIAAALVCAYGVPRALLELQRGDAARPVWLGNSEAQWCALLFAWTVVWLGRGGALAWHAWHLASALFLTALAAFLFYARRRLEWTSWALSRGKPLLDLAGGLRGAASARAVKVVQTPLGLRLTSSRHSRLLHFGLSRVAPPLAGSQADALAAVSGLILDADDCTLVSGTVPGVYHLLVKLRARPLPGLD